MQHDTDYPLRDDRTLAHPEVIHVGQVRVAGTRHTFRQLYSRNGVLFVAGSKRIDSRIAQAEQDRDAADWLDARAEGYTSLKDYRESVYSNLDDDQRDVLSAYID